MKLHILKEILNEFFKNENNADIIFIDDIGVEHKIDFVGMKDGKLAFHNNMNDKIVEKNEEISIADECNSVTCRSCGLTTDENKDYDNYLQIINWGICCECEE